MASVLATSPVQADLFDIRSSNRDGIPMDEGRALGGRIRRSAGLYFDQMEISTIMHQRLDGNQCAEPAEGRLPVILRRR
ncbi:hypothetical protein [Gordonia sp. NPDC058843]|uniref:hypothetical protein n=1 Tax=Gordonia sp. NPDC058843 TaxID=3346648 RepID=UPI0036C6B51C